MAAIRMATEPAWLSKVAIDWTRDDAQDRRFVCIIAGLETAI
jgi:hypothetical protein